MVKECPKCKGRNLERRATLKHMGNGEITTIYPVYCKDCNISEDFENGNWDVE